MKVKSVFIEELSLQVKILQAESRKELAREVSTLASDITKYQYESWLQETFIVNYFSVYNAVIGVCKGDLNCSLAHSDLICEAIYNVNPKLRPDQLYIAVNNQVTLDKGTVKLIDCRNWNKKGSEADNYVIDFDEYFSLADYARQFEHTLEAEDWTLFDNIPVLVRRFNEIHKEELLRDYSPVKSHDIKYLIVAFCIDNFPSLYSFVINSGTNLTTLDIVNTLYKCAIKQNPFLDIKLKDFKKLKSTSAQRADEMPAPVTETQLKSLKSVPKEDILNLETLLKDQVFGQEAAIKGIVNAVQRAYLGVKDPSTPIGAFFFYGSTSTGKTELAKAIARTLTKSKHGLLKISCNTLSSSHSVHTLTGSPPGYVGYEDKGLIEKGLEANNFKVILFDEVEKADRKLFDIVLEMLEEGEILMANGKIINVSNCLIIFTSNMGQGEANKALNTVGFASTSGRVGEEAKILTSQFEKEFKATLKPEFVARLNGSYYFPRLSESDLISIAIATLRKHIKHLSSQKIDLIYNKDLPNFIINCCKVKDKVTHARHIKTFIDMEILKRLGDFIIKLPSQENISLNIYLDDLNDSGLNPDRINFSVIN